MCGIAAILLKQNPDICVQPRAIEHDLNAMIQVMRHRGPDSEGVYIDDGVVGLGMNRLVIVGGIRIIQSLWYSVCVG